MNPKKDTSHHPAFAAQREYFSDDYGAPACMNKRMYAAIKLRVPNSGEEWLDAMIRQSLRDDFAGRAMQGQFAAMWTVDQDPGQCVLPKGWAETIAESSYSMAEAMLKARDTAPSTE